MPKDSNSRYYEEIRRLQAKNKRRRERRAESRQAAQRLYGDKVTPQQVAEFRKRRPSKPTENEAGSTPNAPHS